MSISAKDNSLGFSLIELMVVIAIVALLAALAVPAYQKYIIKAKVNSVVPVLGSVKSQILEYGSVHGTFPSAQDLGYSTDISGTELVDATDISPDLTTVSISPAPLCANLPFMGIYTLLIDATDFGQTYTDYTIATVLYEDADGKINSFCFEGDENGPFTNQNDNVYCDDPGMEFSGVGAFLSGLPGCN